MKFKTLFFFVLLMGCQLVIGQYEITIDAYVLNQETKQPVPYANIGFLKKGIGTVCQSDGKFMLQYDENEISDNDILQISSIGYKTISITAKDLYELLTKDNKIYITPDIFALEQAVVIAEKREKMTIGADHYSRHFMGYWKEKKALGGEIASPMKIRKKNTKLEKLKFYVLENYSDSLLVRVNIYKKHKRKPGTNILTSNIYHTIVTKKGEETINLSPYNIAVSEDIIVSLELIEVYGDDIEFAISGIHNGKGFTKYISQDNWEQKNGVSMAFKMDISYPVSSNKLKKRKKPEAITLYWDTSLSRKDSDLEKELDFLKQYFRKIKETKVNFISFSNTLMPSKTFYVKRGNCKDLLSEIRKQHYNGASNFADLFKEPQNPDQYLVFTDGINTYGDHKFIFGIPVFYINSSTDANNNILQDGSMSSEGYYLNLSKISTSAAIDYISNDIEDRSVYEIDTSKEVISGTVFSTDTIPVQGCKISIKGSLIEAETNANGEFMINAKYQDVLVFTSFGMFSKSVVVDASKKISVTLNPKYTILDEVELKAQRDEREQEIINEEIKKRGLGYANYTLFKEDFPQNAIFFSELIRGRFPGVQVFGFGDEATYQVRTPLSINGPLSPLFVVDGFPFTEPPVFLQPEQIKSISLNSSISGASRYGLIGTGGVFIIKTNASFDEKKVTSLAKEDEYNESPFLISPNFGRPDYLNTLWESDSFSNAKSTYFSLLDMHRLEIPFYVYSADYFKRWNMDFSDQILSNLAELSADNYSVLRTLLFYLEERQEKEKALLLYKKIAKIKPNYAQSYLDLARSYKENNKFTEAFEIYKRILNNDNKNIDFSEISFQAKSQLRHLLTHHRSELPYTDLPNEFLVVQGDPVRIVFDWNDPQAEFELQFVNPERKFYKWSHIPEQNDELIADQVKNGIISKEFIIDESFTEGEWIINIQSFEKSAKLAPTFLKYTIYRNYGLDNETKSIKVVKLYNQEQKVTLDKFAL